MSTNPLLPVVQMGHVEKMADQLQNQPAVHQQILQKQATEVLHRAGSQIAATDSPAKVSRAKNKKRHKKNQQHSEKQPPAVARTCPEEESGNIIDITV